MTSEDFAVALSIVNLTATLTNLVFTVAVWRRIRRGRA